VKLRSAAFAAAAGALGLTGAALSFALVAGGNASAAGAKLSAHLIPAAASSVSLLSLYSDQQTQLRNYITAGPSGQLASYDADAEAISAQQTALAQLVRDYQPVASELAAMEASYSRWLSDVARPELAAAARGDFAAARALQADLSRTRPYVLALRSDGFAVQARLASAQKDAVRQVARAHERMLGALIAVCAVVAVNAVGYVVLVQWRLIRPFAQLRQAADAVAGGRYDTRIPAAGPAEFAALGRSAEFMRTALVTALAERERAEERFRDLFEGAPDAMIAVAEDGSIVMANGQAAGLYGYPAEDLIGLPGSTLMSETSLQALAEGGASATAAGKASMNVTGRRRDGSEFPAEVSLSALPPGGPALRVAAVRDISERLAMEAERERLRQQAREEVAARRRVQSERLESLGQLVGGVAHDFNNLINVIQGYTDFTVEQVSALAEEDARLRQPVEDLEQVRSATQKAVQLIRQLLAFARHDVIRPQVLDLNEVAESAGELLRRTLGAHIELTITADPGLRRTKADRGQLEQVLVNLAVNARDAMPDGGRLTVSTRNFDVDEVIAANYPGLAPGRYVRMQVADDGIGMDRATMERAFEPFFSTKPKGRGTGLGLATVYGITTQARGRIDVYSEPGLGTTISVLLPATDEAAVPEEATPLGHDVAGAGETILLVEDEDRLREMTRRILAGNGYLVTVADSGADAVAKAADPDLPIDLLLTDVVMPGMLGAEVAAQVNDIRPAVPVLLMSGYAQPILDAHGMTPHGFDLVEKPFTAAILLSRVRLAITRAGFPRQRARPASPTENQHHS
jgi:PAS domain S-box-containing protein